ncbi:MAG: S8 family serine peptidase, partial [Anaerolineae bacterium]|nr:S8 family serine peptidase [Anaerolineae bacterium]
MSQKIGRLVCAVLFLCGGLALAPADRSQAAMAFSPALLPAWFSESPTEPGPQVEPEVLRALAAEEDSPLRVVVHLRVPDHAAPVLAQAAASEDRATARRLLADGLQAQLQASRLSLDGLLDTARAQGELLEERDLWIINGMALTARPALIRKLVASPAVAELRLDHYQQYLMPDELAVSQPLVSRSSELPWGIQRIRAAEVWETLAISGTGAVVAGVDTGVDWQHPDLHAIYRGNLGNGLALHDGSWFDAVSGGLYPYDDDGHGTHTIGSAVGNNGIGVAPGARWIGVKVLDSNGLGYDSNIHAGFQWLLAPEGDPALAPDVVVCSWGATNGSSTTFQADVAALRAAGIFPVFAAGNEGPSEGTLRSPASLPGVFAVGASDPYEAVASSSSRGPSPWGEIKPYVVAPGVGVLSTLPGGTYGFLSGTSMATPHVGGVAALLRGISSTITISAMAQVLTATAIPLSTTIPNNASGWGRIDAYAAAIAVAHPAVVSGTVRRSSGGAIVGGSVGAVPHGEMGNPAAATTDAKGIYYLSLTPGLYDLTAEAFGYTPQTRAMVPVMTDTAQVIDFSLTALPTGMVRGQITISPGTIPVTQGVTVLPVGTPVSTAVDGTGRYALSLPTGSYTLEVRGNGYRVARAAVTIPSGGTTQRNFALEPAPTLLLVDEGAWYYAGTAPYWRAALDDLGYVYAETAIRSIPVTSQTLDLDYDVVLWSSPEASPGIVGAGTLLAQYLAGGGRMLLSGQDVGYFDTGQNLYVFPQEYLVSQLAVAYVKDNAASRVLTGQGPFTGITLTIEGGDGADNQIQPDEIAVNDTDKAVQFWQYQGGQGGGLGSYICTPYRALFFSFGYEAIAEASARREVLARSLDWLMQPSASAGLTVTYAAEPHIGAPGEVVTHVVRVRHIGSAGGADAIHVSLSGNRWPSTVTPASATLAPCTSQTFTVRVTVPLTASWDESDFLTLTVHSSLVAQPLRARLHTKSPAPLLLVDDDRWYSVGPHYEAALQALNMPYDVWETGAAEDTVNGGTVLTSTLLRYPLLLWFTGYDWYEPVTEGEEAQLLFYLNQGGRLLLSGQDFIREKERPLASQMGVARWEYDRGVTDAFGVTEHPAGGTWGPVRLEYPFRDWSDVIEPDAAARIVVRGQMGHPVALGKGGKATQTWRSLFYAFPLEALPLAERTEALDRGLGWVSPLGTSTWEVTPTTPLPGGLVTAVLRLRNDGQEMFTTTLSHYLPSELELVTLHSPA